MNAHAATSLISLMQTDGPQGYAAAVRHHLADLPAETVEELTDGLVADLEEQAAEHGVKDLTTLLGPAPEYAAELRSSAGLPGVPGPLSRTERLRDVTTRSRRSVAAQWEMFDTRMSQRSWWPEFRDAVLSLRPAWWALRGIVAGFCLCLLVPLGILTPLFFLACVAGSVALGRGWLSRFRLTRPLVIAGNVLAVVLGAGLLLYWGSGEPEYTGSSVVQSPPGLSQDGQQIENIFAYDSNGRPLKGVRLYDQSGKRIETNAAGGMTPGSPDIKWFPYRDANGTAVWNAYPLYSAPLPANGEWSTDESGVVTDAEGKVIPTPPRQPTPPMAAAIPVTPPQDSGGSTGNPDAAPAAPFDRVSTPVATGSPRVGVILTARVAMWSPAASFRYQWLRAGQPIPGATSRTYKVVAADRGKELAVHVTGTKPGYAPTAKQSRATAAVR